MRLDFWFRRSLLAYRLRKKKTPRISLSDSARIQENTRIFIGKGCSFFELGDGSEIRRLVDMQVGGGFSLGINSVVGVGSFIEAFGSVRIGDRVLMGPHVKIFSSTHEYGSPGDLHKPLAVGDVSIGDDVWVGAGTVIATGVTIGNNSVVGANAFVNADVPSNCVVAGSPARVVKRL
ncbi:DapH/DapD/GlmU-related protein [Zhongshania guokunii]|uniref:DapH/DapD/GlmU-related protein n=1 Tax=Zhongshania guokunii TaxID=641783 RepID=A0ABV3U937_9GAMM